MKNSGYMILATLLMILPFSPAAKAQTSKTENNCASYVSKLAKCEKFSCVSYNAASNSYTKKVVLGLSRDLCNTYEEIAYGNTIVYLSCKLNSDDRKDLVSFYRKGPYYDNGKSYSEATKPGEEVPFQDIPSQLLQRNACTQKEHYITQK